jgi:A/G-specific adenine glycosylase
MFTELINWSQKNFSDLPWRKRRSLYKTVVSEFMLQQTTVATVTKHFNKFIDLYPNFESLSKSTEEEILIAWKGLGYYRRARNLRAASIVIHQDFKSRVPKKLEQLLTIPGIGDYTAKAILGLGKSQNFLAIDTNLERVLSRIFNLKHPTSKKLKEKLVEIQDTHPEIIKSFEQFGGRGLNEALMDLGRVYCKARSVFCSTCPMQNNCLGKKGALNLPLFKKDSAKKEVFQLNLLRVVVRKGKKIYGHKRQKGDWLEGQIELPTFIISTDDNSLKQYPSLLKNKKLSSKINSLKTYKTTITKYRINNHILEATPSELLKISKDLQLKLYKESEETNFSTATTKALKLI